MRPFNFYRFQLTRQQVVYGLERVDLRSTDLIRRCPGNTGGSNSGGGDSGYNPRQFGGGGGGNGNQQQRPGGNNQQQVRCTSGRQLVYRSADGTCNNLRRPHWGSSFTKFLRFLPPVYSDTVGESYEFRTPFRSRLSNAKLPSPRVVSTGIHGDSASDTKQFTMMVMQWGQFLDHDITSTPQSRGFNDSLIKAIGRRLITFSDM